MVRDFEQMRESHRPIGKDEVRYEDLECAAVHALSSLPVEDYLTHPSPQFRYIGEQVLAVRGQCGELEYNSNRLDKIAVIEALRCLVQNSRRILQGEVSGMHCIATVPGLWRRMMCEWPMGLYGNKLADYINIHGLAKGRILELGAGVGNASKFVLVDAETTYIKTDINKSILQMYNSGGILEAFDINSDLIQHKDLDLVFASNVLHCAQDKKKTLASVSKMLGPRGCLVFSEGVPEVQLGRRWCLAPLFGFFDGWWDRGGFISMEQWTEFVSAAGLSIGASEVIRCGQNTLGRIIVCRK
jgi:2-polyprenyl-3-methyl-5-hydroxy-6-metoxy-1,4-benzoquinol methylase